MQQPRMHFDAERGWVVDTPIALTPMELQKCAIYTIKRQTDRIRSFGPHQRDRRAQGEVALQLLKEKGWTCIQQNIIKAGMETVLYSK